MAPTSLPPISLATVIETTKAKIAESPKRAQVVMRATHDQGDTVEVASQVGSGHRFIVDEPLSIGGGNAGPSPIEYALAALGSCQAITYRFWAAHLEMALDSVHVDVEGDIDMRGFFGIDDSVRPGYRAVRVAVRVRGPESPERYEELAAAVDAHCPILDLFTSTVEVTRTMTVEVT